jgi:two-component system CheB/CheR fusion protein
VLKRLQAVFRAPEKGEDSLWSSSAQAPGKIFIVDDEYLSRAYIRSILEHKPWELIEFSSCEAFLSHYKPCDRACIILDVKFPGMGGLELLRQTHMQAHLLPAIVMSGASTIPEAVQSMKYGALDFMEKPVDPEALVNGAEAALRRSSRGNSFRAMQKSALDHLADLTPRQQQIVSLMLRGQPSKIIAADLGISQRTVENHRAAIMKKMGAKSLVDLCEITLEAVWRPADETLMSDRLSGMHQPELFDAAADDQWDRNFPRMARPSAAHRSR